MRKRPNTTDELVDIYTLFRLVDSSTGQDDYKNKSENSLRLQSIFPRHFINKVLNEHILEVKELSSEICSQIFSSPRKDDRIDKQPEHLARVEEYFHSSLHQLYDFVTNLDWYDNEVFVIKDSDDNKYKDFNEFLKFRDRLDEITLLMREKREKREALASSPIESKFHKSNLKSFASASSPRDRRRVRFSKDVGPGTGKTDSVITDEDHREIQTLFALDLQIYAINSFCQQLCSNLWSTVDTNAVRDNLRQIIDSKNKIKATQLEALTKDVRAINRLFLMSLDCLNILKDIYLLGHLSEIVSFEYPRTLKYKLDRIKSYSRWIDKEMEGKIILKLVIHLLQIIFELITFEINSPPLDLNAKTSKRSKADLRRSQENQTNFVLSWLGIDDKTYNVQATSRKQSTSKNSTLAEGEEYKSSSQIMDQMENLHSMVVDLVKNLVKQMFSDRQRHYLLNLAHFGISQYYSDVSTILSSQLAKSREMMKSQSEEDKITGNIDSIAAKIRCLKFIHIMTNLVRLIQDLADSHRIVLEDSELENRISSFVNDLIARERPIGNNTKGLEKRGP